jgi:hypothetical protein
LVDCTDAFVIVVPAFLSSFRRKPESSFFPIRHPGGENLFCCGRGVRALRSASNKGKELDYTRLLSRALRAIRCANVRFGILPSQSGFRRNDDKKGSAEGTFAAQAKEASRAVTARA